MGDATRRRYWREKVNRRETFLLGRGQTDGFLPHHGGGQAAKSLASAQRETNRASSALLYVSEEFHA